eukprot:scaffold243949_cov36-Tisochrysis_lutea.AAC.1
MSYTRSEPLAPISIYCALPCPAPVHHRALRRSDRPHALLYYPAASPCAHSSLAPNHPCPTRLRFSSSSAF